MRRKPRPDPVMLLPLPNIVLSECEHKYPEPATICLRCHVELGMKLASAQEERKRLTEVLEHIGRPGVGLQGLYEDGASDKEVADYWMNQLFMKQKLARDTVAALKKGERGVDG